MKVFISWSGERSRLVASALHDWLPNVIQAVEPWMSSSDIDKGARWSADLSAQLSHSSFSLICLTPENLNAPWILFEAGALSKTIENTFVCPYLFHVEPRNVQWPLAQFQLTRAEKEETLKLLHTMNIAQGNEESLPEKRIDKAFERWWPILEQDLANIPKEIDEPQNTRSERDILNELVELVRGLSRDRIVSDQELLEPKEFISDVVELDPESDRASRRKGVFIGAYVAPELKRLLQARASQNQRILSQEIYQILSDYIARNNG